MPFSSMVRSGVLSQIWSILWATSSLSARFLRDTYVVSVSSALSATRSRSW
jgi:hypothetical protein